MEQRAYEGRHTGGIPFGYDTCWIIENRKKRLKCETEHPGGVHLVEREAAAVRELFRRYSLGGPKRSIPGPSGSTCGRG